MTSGPQNIAVFLSFLNALFQARPEMIGVADELINPQLNLPPTCKIDYPWLESWYSDVTSAIHKQTGDYVFAVDVHDLRLTTPMLTHPDIFCPN